ncbi:MAG: shikimate kinase, partial [Muribaculum sp.]|nr:shikimate kinase [Muribaculum sp.]
MGSGKTTLGRELQRLTGRQFVDLDALIEDQFGMSISDIFALKGEGYFRRLEAETLRSTANMSDAIVALGGGTPCHGDNMDWLLDNGITVFLDAPVEKL